MTVAAAGAPVVVVGASLAGLRAIQALREQGYDGEVVAVGAEARLPYTRPPLSKELLTGEHDEGRCGLDCDGLDVEWRLGERAEGLDPARREVRLSGGRALRYRRLIVATGSRARTWTGRGASLPGVLTLRDLDDALRLRDALRARPRLAVVGGGFVGCEVAASAARLGVDVTMVDVAPHPMPPLGAEAGAMCAELHRTNGVKLRLGVGVAALAGDGALEAVELRDGTRVEADVAVVAVGAVPNTEWLAGSGVPLDARGGVVCDATLTVDRHEDVLAAGDVVSWPRPDGTRTRVEHWTNAAEQGTVAGRNALLPHGERARYAAVPYFWSDQHGIRIQALGEPAAAEATVVAEATPARDRVVAVGSRAGRVVSVVAVNAARRLWSYERFVVERAPTAEVRTAAAADPLALGPPD